MENSSYASIALVHFLFGIFCAYWAQTTNRDPWLWFFLGLFFAPLTGLILLSENNKMVKKNVNSKKKIKISKRNSIPDFKNNI